MRALTRGRIVKVEAGDPPVVALARVLWHTPGGKAVTIQLQKGVPGAPKGQGARGVRSRAFTVNRNEIVPTRGFVRDSREFHQRYGA